MKKIFLLPLLLLATSATGAINWWEQDTICRINPTSCYTSMGMGYETEMWDANKGCWGVKKICPVALTLPQSDEPEAIGLKEIPKRLSPDFDASFLNSDYGDCFGIRKTNKGKASLNGEYVKIWCQGVLDDLGKPIVNTEETIQCGQITYNPQPTCQELAKIGYIAVQNSCCYGKYYNPEKYLIECSGSELPSRIVILNDARDTYTTDTPHVPVDQTSATKLFLNMFSVSKEKHKEYFGE